MSLATTPRFAHNTLQGGIRLIQQKLYRFALEHRPMVDRLVEAFAQVSLDEDDPEGEEAEATTAVAEDDRLSFAAQRGLSLSDTKIQSWKEAWIRKQMQTRESEFTQTEPLSVAIGTYNVNGRRPVDEHGPVDLSPWVAQDDPADLYVFGFQELDLSKEAFVFSDTKREEEWSEALAKALPRSERYVRGNKGGVAISLTIKDTDICFVATHLAAHDDAVARRNQAQHDYLFWLGDLNYRIDAPYASVRQWVEQQNMEELIKNDQLKAQQTAGLAFVRFKEPPIEFMPTYKFDPGTDTWDTSEKQRTPSYTDRILYYEPDEGQRSSVNKVANIEYTSVPELRVSDHKPVRARFLIQVASVIADKYREIYVSVLRQLDALENSTMPTIEVDTQQFDFGECKFGFNKSQSLTIRNTGPVAASFDIVTDHLETGTLPKWLLVDGGANVILQGQEAKLRFTVRISVDAAADLNVGKDAIHVILILRVKNGKDFFITIGGTYVPTFLARTLEDLTYLNVPARQHPLEPIVRKEAGMHVPKEIWLLVNRLLKDGLNNTSLFYIQGKPEEVDSIIEALDTTLELPPDISIEAVATTLLHVLNSLSEPVIPRQLYQRCMECAHAPMLCQQLVAELPAPSRYTFEYVMALLREIIASHEKKQSVINIFAAMFAPILLKSPRSGSVRNRNSVMGECVIGFVRP
ncbi:uncharacterized protein MONBRDRAFT_22078 [Monosiga brevicollis MX1]|uniref:Rho-GAP domain-containing protein n=1 Tax=Monosiga brevicollis TaxID=81824 RepID=A9UPH8_MONBE|nr:uncharacterized protein MONBRDRAFT_22078 [Monosiga brevicollis MX1]EDQ92426.1 predicted protein [Monosiga brevicollis MX1]|eukprot:XP_001742188.1 hypothetical protein [Monosiga brevicollis MX1]